MAGVVLADTTATKPTPGVGVQHWFGVAVENIPPAISRQLKLKPEQGLMVVAVLPGSPAEAAGLKMNDLLIELNNREVTAQEELARAANALDETGSPKSSRITFLREGDRRDVEVKPEPRPLNLMVLGNHVGSFVGNGGDEATTMRAEDVRNFVLPNGAAAQVGPGYRLDLTDPSAITMKSIKEIVAQGKAVVLTQETDLKGGIKNMITVEGKTYTIGVDPLPEELKNLAEQLAAVPAAEPSNSQPSKTILQRVQELTEKQKSIQAELQQLEKEVTTQK